MYEHSSPPFHDTYLLALIDKNIALHNHKRWLGEFQRTVAAKKEADLINRLLQEEKHSVIKDHANRTRTKLRNGETVSLSHPLLPKIRPETLREQSLQQADHQLSPIKGSSSPEPRPKRDDLIRKLQPFESVIPSGGICLSQAI
jgi:hypothetical protein